MRNSQLFAMSLAVALVVWGVPLAAGEGQVDELRFGTSVDAQGVVPAKTHSDKFLAADSIHVTMKVQEAPAKTPLMLSVLDRETEKLIWSENQAVSGGHTTMHFVIPSGAIPPGKYRAKVKLGDDQVAEHEFGIQ